MYIHKRERSSAVSFDDLIEITGSALVDSAGWISVAIRAANIHVADTAEPPPGLLGTGSFATAICGSDANSRRRITRVRLYPSATLN